MGRCLSRGPGVGHLRHHVGGHHKDSPPHRRGDPPPESRHRRQGVQHIQVRQKRDNDRGVQIKGHSPGFAHRQQQHPVQCRRMVGVPQTAQVQKQTRRRLWLLRLERRVRQDPERETRRRRFRGYRRPDPLPVEPRGERLREPPRPGVESYCIIACKRKMTKDD